MIYARNEDIAVLQKNIASNTKSVALVYGRRYAGKTALIAAATEGFNGLIIDYLCVCSSLEGNIYLLTDAVRDALGMSGLTFNSLSDIFGYLGRLDRSVMVILDEFQFLRDSAKRGVVDEELSEIIDEMSDNLSLIICGSDILSMKELLAKNNPLFGKFTLLLHLSEFDYINSSKFLNEFPELSVTDRVKLYSVFGGNPYVLNKIVREMKIIYMEGEALTGDIDITRELIKRLIIPETGALRLYIENILLREIRTSYDIRILQGLGAYRKRYSEIAKFLGYRDVGALDKQLKSLIAMELIEKKTPVNKDGDRKKQYYEISDNLLCFYFTFIFGREVVIRGFGEDYFYDNIVAKGLEAFVGRGLEKIALQYVERQIRSGAIRRASDIGAYWYEGFSLSDEKNQIQESGYFGCSIRLSRGYDVYVCLFSDSSVNEAECDRLAEELHTIPDIKARRICFVSLAGFSFETDSYSLISGDMLYADIY